MNTSTAPEQLKANRIRIALREYDCYEQFSDGSWQRISAVAYFTIRSTRKSSDAIGRPIRLIARVRVRGLR